MKYIFMAGAPGSKWSSVAKNIYFSPDIDRSDASSQREYWHDASGTRQLMHMGAYFDPGMEFGKFFDRIHRYTREECEAEFDRAFAPDRNGIRIIKSHVFSTQLHLLRERWPDVPIILVHRGDDACLDWWVKCGHFDITYPKYATYYQNLQRMAGIIHHQNQGITQAIVDHATTKKIPQTNIELCDILNIARPTNNSVYNSVHNSVYDYQRHDIEVTVI